VRQYPVGNAGCAHARVSHEHAQPGADPREFVLRQGNSAKVKPDDAIFPIIPDLRIARDFLPNRLT